MRTRHPRRCVNSGHNADVTILFRLEKRSVRPPGDHRGRCDPAGDDCRASSPSRAPTFSWMLVVGRIGP